MKESLSSKAELRTAYLEKRRATDKAVKECAEAIIFEKIISLPSFTSAKSIFIYYPIKGEISVLPLLDVALKSGRSVAFPRCNKQDRTMTFCAVSSLSDLEAGAYGILEPRLECPALAQDADTLCIVPALLYAKDGHRLGFGAGYYDRFLADFKGVSIGVALDSFVLESLPHESHDKRLDMIITERSVYLNEK